MINIPLHLLPDGSQYSPKSLKFRMSRYIHPSFQSVSKLIISASPPLWRMVKGICAPARSISPD